MAKMVEYDIRGDIAFIKPNSNIDESNSWQFQEILRDFIDQGVVMIIVDLHLVEYMSSATLGIAAASTDRLEGLGGALLLSRERGCSQSYGHDSFGRKDKNI